MGHGRWGRQRPPTGSAVPRSSGLSRVMRRGVDELSQPVELPDRPYDGSGAASGAGRRLDGSGWVGVARHVGTGWLAGARGCRGEFFRRHARLDDLLTAAQTRVERLRAEVETDPAAGDRRQRAAKERGARERAARIAAAQERMKEQEAEQKEPRASTTDADARVMKMADGGWRPAYNMQIISTPEHQVIVAVDIDTSGSDRGLARPGIETVHAEGYEPSNYLVDGGFTKNDDIEWAHAKDIKMWCPPGQTRHGTDPYAPKKDDGVGVADWRQRMKGEEDKKGEALYRLRAEHECINAHARRMGLRQLSLRGKIKARIHLLWFAVARNMMRFLALHAKAQAAA